MFGGIGENGDMSFGLTGNVPARARNEMLDEPKLSASETKHAAAIVRMVGKLPADGSLVVVHSPSVVDDYKRGIRELRGDVVADATRIIVAPTMRVEAAVTAGLKLPIFRDPMVEYQREHKRALAQAWRL